ncbi:MAG: MupG family TIM beta-alpha barrel fold protein [Selenomonadaceae bacterium]|nr:MupG family TIM beta-alpha barrel fold protein [Selenomonadaceae bacterium]
MKNDFIRGISLYPGLHDCTAEENEKRLMTAAAHGCTALFTSLQLPEADYEAGRNDLQRLLSMARQQGMDVIADYSPEGARGLGFTGKLEEDIALAKKLGVTVLRLDGGLSAMELKSLLSAADSIRFCLNASTVTDCTLLSGLKGTDSFADSKIIAVHNYYPRLNTGLDISFFCEQNRRWQERGIPVGAFIPAAKHRGPVFAGLPTLEEHRDMPAAESIRMLAAMGVDAVFFGDPAVTEEELGAFESFGGDEPVFHLTVEPDAGVPRDFFDEAFAVRPDRARDAVRAADSRPRLKKLGLVVKPQQAKPRPAGTLTIDNELAGRYQGELQITLRDLPSDPTVNVVGHLSPEEFSLLKTVQRIIDQLKIDVT